MRPWILAAALSCFAATPALADNEYQQLVNQQMATKDSLYQSQGYTRVLSTGSQSANSGATDSYNMDLNGGANYSVAGACDRDCSDLDVTVYGPNGAKIVEDTATDDQPVVSFQAPQNGRYRLEVRMYACSANPCFYAASVYRGSGGGGGGSAIPLLSPNGAQSGGGGGGTNYDGQVASYLDQVESTGAQNGLHRLFRSPMQHMNQGAELDYNVNLTRGVSYTFAGACDNDCPDLDIKLLDSGGSSLIEDTATDSFPVVNFTPSANGLYRVRMIMYKCNSAPCSAQVTVMQR